MPALWQEDEDIESNNSTCWYWRYWCWSNVSKVDVSWCQLSCWDLRQWWNLQAMHLLLIVCDTLCNSQDRYMVKRWKDENDDEDTAMMMMMYTPPHILLHSRSSWWPPCKPEVFLSGSFSWSSISTMFYHRTSMEVQLNQLIVNLWKLMISNSDCSSPTWRKPYRNSMWARHSDNVPSEEPGEENHSAWLSR